MILSRFFQWGLQLVFLAIGWGTISTGNTAWCVASVFALSLSNRINKYINSREEYIHGWSEKLLQLAPIVVFTAIGIVAPSVIFRYETIFLLMSSLMIFAYGLLFVLRLTKGLNTLWILRSLGLPLSLGISGNFDKARESLESDAYQNLRSRKDEESDDFYLG